MRMRADTRRVVRLAEAASPEPESFKLQDLCDGISREQYRIQRLTRDQTILSARDRVLSARSKVSDAQSVRASSRMSSRSRLIGDRASTVITEHDAVSNAPSNAYSNAPSNGSSYPNSNARNNGHSNTFPDIRADVTEVDSNRQLVVMPTNGRDSPTPSDYAESTYRSELDDARPPSTGYGLGDQDSAMMRSYASLSGVACAPVKSSCVRSRTAISRDVDEGTVHSLSRQCCDVLGPKVCHQCALIKRRVQSARMHELSLSRLQISERNYADTISLKRVLPHLSPAEIEDRIVSGEIQRLPLRERLYETKQRLASEQRRSSASLYSTRAKSEQRLLLNSTPTTTASTPDFNGMSSAFFVNIRDLNSKLVQRRLKTNWAQNRNELSRSVTAMLGADTEQQASQSELRYKQFYEPPLLPKACQNAEPAFFAGRNGEYKLPDRLPDTVVQGQISDLTSFNAAWTGSYPQSEVEEDSGA